MLRLLRTITAAAALVGGAPLALAQQTPPAGTSEDPPQIAPAPESSRPGTEGRSIMREQESAPIPLGPEDEDAEPPSFGD
jgi:hypothetical protein